MTDAERRALAEVVREACLKAVREGYEQAAMSGLCHEGAVEASLDAVRMLDIAVLLEQAKKRP